jgi:acetolactate synthase regulatory subunit
MAIDLFDETMGLLAELERHGVPYAVAGALALAIHGVPRATTDIDLLVRRDDVEAILEVARARGFRVQALPMRFSDGLEVRRSSKVDATVMLTLDLLLVNENLEPVWASRERVATERGDVWVVSRQGLIEMKAWAGREQDLADIRRLRELDR